MLTASTFRPLLLPVLLPVFLTLLVNVNTLLCVCSFVLSPFSLHSHLSPTSLGRAVYYLHPISNDLTLPTHFDPPSLIFYTILLPRFSYYLSLGFPSLTAPLPPRYFFNLFLIHSDCNVGNRSSMVSLFPFHSSSLSSSLPLFLTPSLFLSLSPFFL